MSPNENKNKENLKAELADFCRRSFERHLISGTGGNLSVAVPQTGTYLVTPSGVSLADMTPELAIEVSLEGEVIQAPEGLRPSKETSFHLEAYKLHPEAGGLCHLHPPYATAFANKGVELPMVTVSARGNLGSVPCIESAVPGSSELCGLVCTGLGAHPDARALLMKEHGILTWGADLMTAYYLADLVEDTAMIAFLEQNIK